MKPVKHNPKGQFPLMSNWFHNFFEDDDIFGTTLLNRDIVPAVNVIENDRGFDIDVAAPGFDRDDFNVSVDGDTLLVSAERKIEDKEEKKGRFMRKEFSYASFSRAFTLPEAARVEKMTANYRDGILKIHLDRKPEKKRPEPKRIEIH